jgi:PTH1 family peptidyl-tRNA hydrolase
MIKLIVGLGNPGQQYEKTRHNAGFAFLEALISVNGGNWLSSSQFQGDYAVCAIGGHKLVLLKPMTYMNRSGASVGSLMRYYKFSAEELLVVHDELDLPEGVLKLKRDGGHAGHNGLRDIIAHIDSRDFYRLRIGIGRPDSGKNIADYVLSRPSKEAGMRFDDVHVRAIAKLDLLMAGKVAEFNALALTA